MHTTIYSISESPLDAKVIWVGTDDGNLQLTRDSGKTWTNVATNLPELPALSWVSWVEASRFDPGTAYAAFDRHTFGDMAPWVYRTSDFGKTWTRIVSPAQGVRGYAHVIKEDTVKASLLFLGTEMGLWISLDGGDSWVQFKGGDFPNVAVRDLQIQKRQSDLVLATHGRGIWIIDDVSPLRALTKDVLRAEAAFVGATPAQQRMPGEGGWVEGDATFVGENPISELGAVITYYQRSRHVYGHLELQVLDEKGAVLDTLPASNRPGLNRVLWSMRLKPPRAPRAATLAYSATTGPRVLPGNYKLRLIKGDTTIEGTLTVALDRRAPFTIADRRANLHAAMKARALFEDMTTVSDRIEALVGQAKQRQAALKQDDALAHRLKSFVDGLTEARKKIVATKEGGAITGEERIREHADYVYRALLGWEGRPAKYQVDRIAVLNQELGEVRSQVDQLAQQELPALGVLLKERGLEPLALVEREPEEESGGVSREQAEAALGCWAKRTGCQMPASVAARNERD